MNWQREHTASERGLLDASKKKKRVKKEPFTVRKYVGELHRLLENMFHDSFEDFALDEWRWAQRRRVRNSGISRLEDWLKRGLHDTLYARRILRKGRR